MKYNLTIYIDQFGNDPNTIKTVILDDNNYIEFNLLQLKITRYTDRQPGSFSYLTQDQIFNDIPWFDPNNYTDQEIIDKVKKLMLFS